MTRGLRSWEERYLRDPRRNCLRKLGVVAVCLQHPEHAAPLYRLWSALSRLWLAYPAPLTT